MTAEGDLRTLVDRAWEAQYARPRDSHAWAREALASAEARGDASVRAWANLTIGNYQLRYASPAEARASLGAAEAEFVALGDHRGDILARNSLARARMMEGDPKGAYDMFRAILAEEGGRLSPLDRFYMLNGLSGCCAALGDSPQSIGYLFEALGQVRSENARPQTAMLLCNLGGELVAVGDYEEALTVLNEAESLVAELQHPRLRVGIVANLCDCLVHLGRAADALPRARALMADPEAPHISAPEGNVFTTAALVFLKNDCDAEAEAALAIAEREAGKHGGPCLAWALYLRATMIARSGNRDGAISRLKEARSRFEDRTPLLLCGLVLESLAELMAQAGRHAEAFALQKEYFQVYERRLGMGTRARYYAVQIRYELNRLRDERDRAREEALRDSLTGLYNRRYLDSVLSALISLFSRTQQPLAVAMLDLDYFKEVNTAHGHLFGDEVLRTVARVLMEGTRAGDVVCRYGGEEFCLLFPNSTAEDAEMRVSALLEATRNATTTMGDIVKSGITFSAGVCGFPADGVLGQALIDAADRILFTAKNQGRGRVMR
jgi:diguanylate cyclase (GGDEF)-like protein